MTGRHPQNAEDVVEESSASALLRMVDFRIPLIWLLGGFIIALTAVINMYFQLQEVSKTMATLVISVNAAVAANTVRDGEVALLKFRVTTVEQDVDRIKGAVILQNQPRKN